MIIELFLSDPELHSQVIQALSNAGLIDKVDLNTVPDPCQVKPSRLRGLTTIRTCRTQRTEDNTLVCSACGRKLPSTREGELDSDQLVLEIASRRW